MWSFFLVIFFCWKECKKKLRALRVPLWFGIGDVHTKIEWSFFTFVNYCEVY